MKHSREKKECASYIIEIKKEDARESNRKGDAKMPRIRQLRCLSIEWGRTERPILEGHAREPTQRCQHDANPSAEEEEHRRQRRQRS